MAADASQRQTRSASRRLPCDGAAALLLRQKVRYPSLSIDGTIYLKQAVRAHSPHCVPSTAFPSLSTCNKTPLSYTSWFSPTSRCIMNHQPVSSVQFDFRDLLGLICFSPGFFGVCCSVRPCFFIALKTFSLNLVFIEYNINCQPSVAKAGEY